MKKYKVYAGFSEYSSCGYCHHVIDPDDDWAESGDGFTFLASVELPLPQIGEIMKAGVAAIDQDIAKLQVQINQKQEKKNQLLALTHEV